jgi:hypothetical protein
MANELEITAAGDSLNLYAIIRRQSDAKVWDVTNTAFATWADGSIADYDVALTAKSGDLYQADFPTDITAGTKCRVTYYRRDGATPATDDLILETEEVTWTGQGITGGGSVTLDAGALCTLAALKRELHITATTHDDLLKQIINDVSGLIKRVTGRDFTETAYQDWARVDDRGRVMTTQFPLTQVQRVGVGSVAALTATYAGSDIRARVSVTDASVVLTSTSAAGTTTTNTLTFASNPTFSTMVTAVSAVSDWTGALSGDDGMANNLIPISGLDALNVTASLDWPSTDVDGWHADLDTGIIDIWTTDLSGQDRPLLVLVEYKAGYSTIPNDVAGVCIQLSAVQFHRSKLNTAVGSEGLGDWSYSPATPEDLSNSQLAVLRPFMDAAKGVAV